MSNFFFFYRRVSFSVTTAHDTIAFVEFTTLKFRYNEFRYTEVLLYLIIFWSSENNPDNLTKFFYALVKC